MVLDALEQAVADVDPTEVVSLLDALDDPGDAAYSEAARQRFGLLSAELAYLRRHGDEPVLDLTRRIIATLGLDVELSATPEFDRSARRDQLGAFLDAVAAYVDVDGEASLTGLLAYLQAEIDTGTGLDRAVPSDREAVKLLTVHKAKGLEWEVVFLPALMQGIFPSDRVTDNWVTNPAVLPADLRGDAASIPQLADASNSAISAYKARLSEQQQLAEDRLAYVGATRAKQLLVGSGHTWRAELVKPRTPSAYLRSILEAARAQDQVLAEASPAGRGQPAGGRRGSAAVARAAGPRCPAAAPGGGRRSAPGPGPVRRHGGLRGPGGAAAAARRRGTGRRLGCRHRAVAGRGPRGPLGRPGRGAAGQPVHHRGDAARDRSGRVRRRTGPADAAGARRGPPASAPGSTCGSSATSARPWPPARWGSSRWSTRTTCPTGRTPGPRTSSNCASWARPSRPGSSAGPPRTRSRRPFAVLVNGRLLRGRIDAIYALTDPAADGDFRFRVVDWKTSRTETADPLQLAIYRLAWAEANQLPLESVDAGFYYVRTDRLVRPPGLATRAEIERLLSDPG